MNVSDAPEKDCRIAIIGGGPAGLMAAEVLSREGAAIPIPGLQIDVYESMPTLGRKFLRAGLGGLNITHSEPFEAFRSRYGDKQETLKEALEEFPPEALRNWVHELGIETFVGSSGRVFPKEMKAAPLLRAWVHRLRKNGVNFHHRHKWLGIESDGSLKFELEKEEDGANEMSVSISRPEAVILALGGASWPQLGSTGEWTEILTAKDVELTPWQSANCGFNVSWSDHLKNKFAGAPLKAISLTFKDADGKTGSKEGELLISEYGVEGSLIYAFSKSLREHLRTGKETEIMIDLLPGRSAERVLKDLSKPRGSRSISRHLERAIGKDALKRALIFEILDRKQIEDPQVLAGYVKALPIKLESTRPIEEAISSAGGIKFESLDKDYMLKALPGFFVAGEMLDWEAPTGGYLLTACFATGKAAAHGALKWLKHSDKRGD